MAPLVYLDTNVFVYLKEVQSPQADALAGLVAAGWRSGEPRMATSELTLSELLPKPYADGRDDLVLQYETWMIGTPWLKVSPVDREALRLAARLRVAYRPLKLPDAIHLATALGMGCRYFLTGDTGLRGRYAGAVSICRPELAELQDLLAEMSIQ